MSKITANEISDELKYYGVARQCIINPNFVVNQRGYVSNAVLAAGVYGHDRWKAGASGGDYTFTQLASSTTITIKTGKSLIQVIEDKNVLGGTYTLSWTGTAQARFGINSATPSGAYASSPITVTGQTAGTVMSIEFNEGTLGNVICNSGSYALPFQPKSYEEELRACQRYYEQSGFPVVADDWSGGTGVNSPTHVPVSFKVTKRISPTITTTSDATTTTGTSNMAYTISSIGNYTDGTVSAKVNGFYIYVATANVNQKRFGWTANAEL